MGRHHFAGPVARVGAILALSAVIVGCGSDIDETEYGESNRRAFLAACTDTGEDTRLIRDVCECTYEQIEVNMVFSDLAALEESLKLDSLRPLPDEVAGYMAECFLAEVDL